MKNKTVLVTGAGGFIGSHLTERLIEEAAHVKAFVHYNSRNDCGLLRLLPEDKKNALEFIAGDIADPVSVYKAMKGVDIVFHLAALIGIPYSYQAPNAYIETNVRGTLNVLNAAQELGTLKVVHTSTSEVYGTALYTPIDEKHALQAQSPYSASKIAADKLAESYYLSFETPVATIRPFNTYGPRQSLRAVIPTIITQALKSDQIKLGSTSPIRDFNFVKDTVDGFIRGAKCDCNNGRVLNIGSGVAVSIAQVVSTVSKIMNKEIVVIEEQARIRPQKSEVLVLLADSSNASTLTGWKSEYNLEKGLTETVKWFEKNLHTVSQDGKYVL